MSRSSLRAVSLVTVATFLLFVSIPAFSTSQVRIVRLSYISGGVEIDRTGGGFEKAIVNLPIAQGTRLRTAEDGRAEVEFEDGSTLRLIPRTAVEFPQLSLADSGDKESVVKVSRGTVYFDGGGSKHDRIAVEFGREKLAFTRAAHTRVTVGNQEAAVAVLKGDVQIEGASGTMEVKKNQTASFDLSNKDQFTLAKEVAEEPFDAWDKQQDDYHLRYASNSYQSYSPYAYGTSDLSYYGNFFNAPGYGMLWQPYFVGMGWDPFMDGAWAFSPGWGFGWVSAYPWGWTPYHYGAWVFSPAYGWAWQPGGAWTTWYGQPVIANAPAGFVAPKAPTTGTSTVLVNRGTALAAASGSKIVLRSNSAGLGVPRGEVANMAKVSQKVQTQGTVTERTHPVPITMASEPGRGSGSQPASRASQPMPRMSSPPPPPAPRASAPAPGPGMPHR